MEKCESALAVVVDPDKLSQILLNLLSNAVKFTDVGGVIRVRCAAHAGQVAITIADTEKGIATDHLGRLDERLVQPFVQIGRTL